MSLKAHPTHFRHADGSRQGPIPVPPSRGAQSARCAPPEARADKVGSRHKRMRAVGACAGQLAPAAAEGLEAAAVASRACYAAGESGSEGEMGWAGAAPDSRLPPGRRKKSGRRIGWEPFEKISLKAGEP